jgi:hypothetical protein
VTHRRLLLGWLGVALAGCSREVPGPAAATLELTLNAPAPGDGAILFTLSGGPIDSVEAPGYRLYSTAVETNTYRLIVMGRLTPGSVARIHIPDQDRAGDYSAAVGQVAVRKSYRLQDPAVYSLDIVR